MPVKPVEKQPEELSEDDKRLQEELNMLVEKITGPDQMLYLPALESMRDLIRTSTTSMTSVPMPLKFLRVHYGALKEALDKITEQKAKNLCASIISVLAMGQDQPGARECLKFCLVSTQRDVGDWGHEYVRQLEGEIAEEWAALETDQDKAKLLPLIESIIGFDMRHNAEIQACDLLMEIDRLELLDKHMDSTNYPRVCLYLVGCSVYVEEPERAAILNRVLEHYLKFNEYPRALCLAMQLNNTKTMSRIFSSCTDVAVCKQLAYMVGRQQLLLDLSELDMPSDLVSELNNIMTNAHINDHFQSLARELDIMEPKTPEEVYKTWLEGLVLRPTYNLDAPMDSARHNLASTFVNAFVNAGFSRDKLVCVEEGNKWMYKNKQHAMLSAAASLGLIHLWDVDGGLTPIDKYLYTSEDYIKSGALLALGIVNCGVRNECDPALALLSDYILHESSTIRIGAVLGLGLAYAGTRRQDVVTYLLPVLSDKKSSSEVVAMGALACSLIMVGTGDAEVVECVLQTLLDLPVSELQEGTYSRFLPLALGLCYLGWKDETEATKEALKVLPEPFRSMAQQMLKMCAYAGTGDVLVIQEQLQICSEHYTPSKDDKKDGDKKDDKKDDDKKSKDSKSKDLTSMQAVAALSVAVIAMGEEIGSEMTTRIFGQLGRYGEPAVRRAVPLAIALSSISNPQLSVIDVLNKYSHDLDEEVAHNAIFSMGLVGAGTNNARLATMLRQLAQYHAKNTGHLFMVRIAQGLTHLGKGTLSLSPFNTDRQIMNPVAVAGLLITLVSFLDTKNIILGKSHYLLYTLATAMYPRWLVTLDEELTPMPVSVRVGQAVDVIGKAGTPKTIAGVHTHTTPVLLAVGERAELATDDYTPLTPVMEGFVILRKKPVETA
ncbi:26S proteasome non-ATPase regulatory subunit 2 [Nilaparvata lugens]|uniref:26S proteasome non-ATPase regulatory subunit 2 n=1 Tax=Nilaparvata lugens TaxID=108931 RepID=A0A896M516_NILLU|nr:26S proteasome non-ATPase regulatory subunit 2 [Nilaparvata lugens]QSC88207.1 26S proteasome non-ATPase regulatory subunit 2-like protein [Nilaparvata lugens]